MISRDGKSLAMALDDDFGTDLWTIPTTGGKLQRITDFAPRRTFIARRMSWSADGKWILAAVGEGGLPGAGGRLWRREAGRPEPAAAELPVRAGSGSGAAGYA